MHDHQNSSVAPDEIARFDALADRWWDENGPMRPLHQMNPARIAWIVDQARARFGAMDGLPVLDVGCGAGLAAEAMAAQGCDVLGIDAAPDVIAAAVSHAEGRGLALRYRVTSAEALAEEPARFKLITALEVIEHVVDPASFLRSLTRLAGPGALLILSTIDRSPASYVVAKLMAEYALRLLPVGTHSWKKFIRPTELARHLRAAGWRPVATAGLVPNLSSGNWRTTTKPAVNYLLAAAR